MKVLIICCLCISIVFAGPLWTSISISDTVVVNEIEPFIEGIPWIDFIIRQTNAKKVFVSTFSCLFNGT